MKTISISLTIIVLSVSMYFIGRKDAKPQKEPINGYAIICTSQPYGTLQDKWQRMTTMNSRLALLLKEDGRAEIAFPQTLECLHKGEKIYMRETWWRRIPVNYQHRACGDYTRPEVPNPKILSV